MRRDERGVLRSEEFSTTQHSALDSKDYKQQEEQTFQGR
jgi:hypothetical protein